MRYVSATDAKQRFAAILDAAQRGPVTIRKQNREVAVMLSREDYERLRSSNASEFKRFCDRISDQAVARGLDEKQLKMLLKDD